MPRANFSVRYLKPPYLHDPLYTPSKHSVTSAVPTTSDTLAEHSPPLCRWGPFEEIRIQTDTVAAVRLVALCGVIPYLFTDARKKRGDATNYLPIATVYIEEVRTSGRTSAIADCGL